MIYYLQKVKERLKMEYRMEYVRGHIEVYSARGEFLFSADTMAEADAMLEE